MVLSLRTVKHVANHGKSQKLNCQNCSVHTVIADYGLHMTAKKTTCMHVQSAIIGSGLQIMFHPGATSFVNVGSASMRIHDSVEKTGRGCVSRLTQLRAA